MEKFITAFEKQTRSVLARVYTLMCAGADSDFAVWKLKKEIYAPYVWDEVEKRLAATELRVLSPE